MTQATDPLSEERTQAKLELARKLLAKAEDPATTEAERLTYNQKVAELIAEYGIDRALLANSGQVRDVVGDRIIFAEAPYSLDKIALLNAICRALEVRCIRLPGGGGNNGHLFGFEADLDRVEILYTSLLVQASFGLAGLNIPTNIPVVTYRKGWWMGFTHAVFERLEAAEQRARQSANQTPTTDGRSFALVLVERKDQVAQRVKQVYPSIRTTTRTTGSARAYGAGKEAGNRADLGGTRVTPSAPKAIGA